MSRISLLNLNDDLKPGFYHPPLIRTEKTTYLGTFTKFFFTQRDHFFSLATEIRNQVIQIIAAGTSWGVFYGSAKKYAESQSPVEGTLYVASTTVAATIFTYVVSDEFFTKHQNKVARKLKKIPTEETLRSDEEAPELYSDAPIAITQIIKVPTIAERRWATAYITGGACAASWPFTFVGLQYSMIKASWFLIAYGLVLQLDNTVLHFLAIYLAFNHKGYGFLRTAWSQLARWVKLVKIKDVNLLNAQLLEEQRAADCAGLIDILTKKLIQSRPYWIEKCLGRPEENKKIRTELFDFDQSSDSGLENLLSLIQMNPNHALDFSPKHSYVTKAVHVIGAIETDLSYLGYMVGLFRSVLNISAQWNKGLQGLFVFIAGVVPNYFFITLMSYVGGGAAERFLSYAVDCFKNRKILLAPEIRLNLTAFYLYVLLAIPITWYSPGSAPQINEDNLPEPYAHPLAINAQYGVRLLIAIIFIDFFIVAARKIMIYGRNSEARDFFRFLQSYDDAVDALKLFEPRAIEADIKILTPEQKKILFGMDEAVLDEKLNHAANLHNKLQKEVNESYLPTSLYSMFFNYQIRTKNRLGKSSPESSPISISESQVPLLRSIQ